jgi:hypothetical protein
MPDNDIVPSGVRKPWKPAAELAIGGHPAQLVADECGRALAAELREGECAPAIVVLAEKLDQAIHLSRPDIYAEAASEILRSDATPITSAVVAQGERLLELPGVVLNNQMPTSEALLEGALRRLSEASLFGSKAMLGKMHRMAGLSVDGLDDYTNSILESVPARAIAESLVRAPEKPVRAPASRSKASTADMMWERLS